MNNSPDTVVQEYHITSDFRLWRNIEPKEEHKECLSEVTPKAPPPPDSISQPWMLSSLSSTSRFFNLHLAERNDVLLELLP